MKPAVFEYFDPETVEEVLDLLAQYGDEAKVLAGGQSLVPLLNMRLASYEVIIDLNRVKGLDYQRYSKSGLALGALVRQSVLEDDPLFASRQPLIAEAIPYIGHRSIRHRSTVGGSIAHADPAAEWPALVAALEAELVVRQAGEPERILSADEFFDGPLMSILEPEELLVEVRLPLWPADAGWSFIEFSRRHGDFALVGVAARLQLDSDRRCSDARLALLGVGDTPIRAYEAESLLQGEPFNDVLIAAAAQQASDDIEPDDDLHASADYRRHLTRILVGRGLKEAASRVRVGYAQRLVC